MSAVMGGDIKRWTAKRETALNTIQGKITVYEVGRADDLRAYFDRVVRQAMSPSAVRTSA